MRTCPCSERLAVPLIWSKAGVLSAGRCAAAYRCLSACSRCWAAAACWQVGGCCQPQHGPHSGHSHGRQCAGLMEQQRRSGILHRHHSLLQPAGRVHWGICITCSGDAGLHRLLWLGFAKTSRTQNTMFFPVCCMGAHHTLVLYPHMTDSECFTLCSLLLLCQQPGLCHENVAVYCSSCLGPCCAVLTLPVFTCRTPLTEAHSAGQYA